MRLVVVIVRPFDCTDLLTLHSGLGSLVACSLAGDAQDLFSSLQSVLNNRAYQSSVDDGVSTPPRARARAPIRTHTLAVLLVVVVADVIVPYQISMLSCHRSTVRA